MMEQHNQDDIDQINDLNATATRLAKRSEDLRVETENKIRRATVEFRILVGLIVMMIVVLFGMTVAEYQQGQRNAEVLELVKSVVDPEGEFMEASRARTQVFIDSILDNQQQNRTDILAELADIREELGLPPSDVQEELDRLEVNNGVVGQDSE